MKQKNWVMRLAGLAFVLTLVTSSLVAGTYAKYTGTFKGVGEARVAKFAVSFNGTDSGDSWKDEQTLDIFAYTADDINVGDEEERIIAPGAHGTFAIEVKNHSEVSVNVTMALEEENASNIPIYYTITTSGGEASQRYSSKLTGGYGGSGESYKAIDGEEGLSAALATAFGTNKLAAYDGTNTAATTKGVKLNWYWGYNTAGTGQTDSGDTELGQSAANPTGTPAKVQVTLKASAVQVEPTVPAS